MRERPTCSFDGCTRLGRNKGYYKGETRYDHLCETHHKNRQGHKYFPLSTNSHIPNTECSICGWDEGPCDRHRRIPDLGYVQENVVVLCPNHHRLAHLGVLVL